MLHTTHARKTARGFTIIELAITFAIIGILAAVAIPIFMRHKNNAKTAEVKSNLASLRIAEEAFYSETGLYYAADAEPALIPGGVQVDFDIVGSDFVALGWVPEGRVYFSYAITVSEDDVGYTADAGADMDTDGVVQLWGLAKPDGSGAMLNGGVGCEATTFLTPMEIGRCTVDSFIY
jgi:prepilin-type N-terminal cleavage/methylation domain-containing protein